MTLHYTASDQGLDGYASFLDRKAQLEGNHGFSPVCLYTDERQAREAFASAEGLGWNCYLWELAPRHEPHNAMFSGDPRDADDTTGRR